MAGPAHLSSFSPDQSDTLAQVGLTNCFDMHVPSTLQAVRVVNGHLASAKYRLEQELDHDDVVDLAGHVLGYQDFGQTVPRIVNYGRELSATASQARTVFVQRIITQRPHRHS